MPKPLPMKGKRSLEREEMFAVALVSLNFNATQAAIAVGIPPAGAATMATQLLRRPNVLATIDRTVKEMVAKHKLSIDTTLTELGHIGFANMEDYTRLEGTTRVLDLSNCTRAQLAAIAELNTEETVIKTVDRTGEDGEVITERMVKRKTKFKLHDKVNSLVNIIKFLQGNLGRFDGATVNNFNNTTFVDQSQHLTITAADAEATYRQLIAKK